MLHLKLRGNMSNQTTFRSVLTAPARETPMLVHHLKASGLLSFGPNGIDLPLESLNVLIGPNGSGKSNLLEVFALLHASPTKLPAPVKKMGGMREWLWKGDASPGTATIDTVVSSPPRHSMGIRHVLEITENGDRFEVTDERIENEPPHPGKKNVYFFYRFQDGHPVLKDHSDEERKLRRENVKPEESVLSQMRDPERYPVLHWLQEQYGRIGLYRSWTFGPDSEVRLSQSAHIRSDTLSDGGMNLALVLSRLPGHVRRELVASLSELFGEIEGFRIIVQGGEVSLALDESGGGDREIPATRLSDGTLRYLYLLAILLDPEPPPLVAIEEPELGLHPDVIPHIAEIMVQASSRMQLVVTTHSRMLVDALSNHTSSIVVCEKENGESRFERLDPDRMKVWLDKYSLGELWSSGEIGGNRW